MRRHSSAKSPDNFANDPDAPSVYGDMKTKTTLLQSLVVVACMTAVISAQNRRGERSFSIDGNGDRPVTSCGDLRVTYNRQPAQTAESELSLPSGSTLRTNMNNGGIFITGWDRNEFSVKTCKAVPADDPNATSSLSQIVTTNSNGTIAVTGPQDGDWSVNLIVRAPRLSNMDIQTRNGPMSLRDLAGVIHLNAANGPISLNNIGGVVETSTTNGPIALKGASGDHRLSAANGPISVELSGNRWDGPGLQVTTKNGPLAVSIPDGYNSGIAIQTSPRTPVSCRASVCAGTSRTLSDGGIMRIGNGDPVVRLSTSNGPLAIQGPKN